MSRPLETRLPTGVTASIESPTPELVAIPLLSLDDQHTPHVALLSFFELAYRGGHIYCWLSSSSNSVRFLTARPACTLVFASKQGVYYVKGDAILTLEVEGQSVFRIALRVVLEDLPSRTEGAAALLSGIAFQLPDKVIRQKQRLKQEVLTGVQHRLR